MKSITLILIAFILFSSTVFSQGLSSLDFSIGTGMSYRTLIDNDEGQDVESIIDLWDNINSKKVNWHLGVNINKQLSEKMYLKTGLRLSTFGYHEYNREDGDLQWPSQHDGNGGFDPTIEPNEPFLNSLSTSVDYWFIEIPLAFRWEQKKNKIIPFVELGFSPHYYLTSVSSVKLDDTSETDYLKEEEVNSLNFFGTAAIGFNYIWKQSLQVFAQGNFSHQLNKLSDTSISKRLYHYGLEVGLRKQFGNTDPLK